MSTEMFNQTLRLDCPVCKPEEREPLELTAASLVDCDSEVWVSLLCPVCYTLVIFIITIEGSEEQ